jgi:hypothetical protein
MVSPSTSSKENRKDFATKPQRRQRKKLCFFFFRRKKLRALCGEKTAGIV